MIDLTKLTWMPHGLSVVTEVIEMVAYIRVTRLIILTYMINKITYI